MRREWLSRRPTIAHTHLSCPEAQLAQVRSYNLNLLHDCSCSITGKTLLAKTLARVLDVPFSVSDATSFTQARLTMLLHLILTDTDIGRMLVLSPPTKSLVLMLNYVRRRRRCRYVYTASGQSIPFTMSVQA